MNEGEYKVMGMATRSFLPEVAGNAAMLVDPEDRAGLADTMARMVGEEPLREDLRERGQKQRSASRGTRRRA